MILVVGSGGQLGQAILSQGRSGSTALVGRSRAELDIADVTAVRETVHELRPELIVNAAAYTAVDAAESESEAAHRVNALAPGVLAAAAAELGSPIIHISTDYVFDGRKPGPYNEEDAIAPIGVYGRTKAAGEEAVRAAQARHVILRTAWLYSARGRNFLTTMIRLAGTRDELRVVSDQVGSPTSADDLADAILRIASTIIAGQAHWGTYHCAGQGTASWHLLAERIVDLQAPYTGRRPAVIPISTAEYPTAACRPANSVLDCARFEHQFGFRPPVWEEAVERTVTAVFSEVSQ